MTRPVLRGKGPSLGFPELDEHFHGQMGVTFLIAAPKTYKSWTTVNAFIENIEQERNPYLYSLELPALESYWRWSAWPPTSRTGSTSSGPDARRAKAPEAGHRGDGRRRGRFSIDKPNMGSRSVAQLVEKALDSGPTASSSTSFSTSRTARATPSEHRTPRRTTSRSSTTCGTTPTTSRSSSSTSSTARS
jgi:hypothetical protein